MYITRTNPTFPGFLRPHHLGPVTGSLYAVETEHIEWEMMQWAPGDQRCSSSSFRGASQDGQAVRYPFGIIPSRQAQMGIGGLGFPFTGSMIGIVGGRHRQPGQC
uniref:Uncharacterized protein n=1 Tax=Physcomitrium patens TaxID=3218 RepID=A0A2K1JBY6_PHYPA|nr:hypothetical protein PHYPA_019302 [Physcomitrium patens]